MACQHDPGRGPPTPCKFFILDVSEMAKELGLPTCSEVCRPAPCSWLFHTPPDHQEAHLTLFYATITCTASVISVN